MKTPALMLALAGLALTPSFAQVAATAPALISPADVVSGYEVVERDAHSRVWARVSYVTNELGDVLVRTNSFVELQTGLHYRASDSDQWLASEAKIEILPKNAGAVAAKGQYQAILPPEIKSGIIELRLPEGQWRNCRYSSKPYSTRHGDDEAGYHLRIA